MITVESRESPATAQDVEALLSELDARPGLWMGCDVASEGLFRKTSIACAVPAVRFSLDGTTLSATALTPVGGGLLAAFGNTGGSHRSGMAVLAELRRFLAMFDKRAPELGFYGAFSFDYFLLGSDPLPDDGRRRFVLYFPERVLIAGETGARWIDLRFAGVAPGPVAEVEAVRIHAGVGEPPAGRHAERVAQGIEKLKRGELYSLVLSQTFRRRTRVAPARAFAAAVEALAMRMAHGSLAAWKRRVAASSGYELLVDRTLTILAVNAAAARPAKGTMHDAALFVGRKYNAILPSLDCALIETHGNGIDDLVAIGFFEGKIRCVRICVETNVGTLASVGVREFWPVETADAGIVAHCIVHDRNDITPVLTRPGIHVHWREVVRAEPADSP